MFMLLWGNFKNFKRRYFDLSWLSHYIASVKPPLHFCNGPTLQVFKEKLNWTELRRLCKNKTLFSCLFLKFIIDNKVLKLSNGTGSRKLDFYVLVRFWEDRSKTIIFAVLFQEPSQLLVIFYESEKSSTRNSRRLGLKLKAINLSTII